MAFIGGGNMATSIISGLITDGHNAQQIFVSDTEHEKLATLAANFGIRSVSNNIEAILAADVVILAVKPQVLQILCTEICEAVQKRSPLIVSIAAGVSLDLLQHWLGQDLAIIRTMPNIPAMLQSGATALYADHSRTTAHQRDVAESVMRAVGVTRWVEQEQLLDAVTAISGSGPAYFFLVMEAMEQIGVDLGLDAETAHLLTIQTALGAARMAMESSDTPAVLRHKVTSRGGTTERALKIFEDGGLQVLFKKALTGARDRSAELSRLFGDTNG
ncbi:pyrroline-5-carboxylate reductase [Achromatium sp. WMS2]|nr:pyrroline-5-carboxylate reductase [Achromatium sp. WMS2]